MALTEIIKTIDALKIEADSLRPIATDRIKVLNDKLRLDWNYNSNAIEGNTLTLSETRVLLRAGIHAGNKLGRHYEEIKLHNDVLLTLEELVKRNEPMTEVLIRSLHHELMGDDYFVSAYDSLGNLINVKGRPGEYKDKTNGIQRIVNGKDVFIPFKTPDQVRTEMPELIQWYRQEEESAEMHPVMLAAIFHFRFVTLHPFDDGNGRMSRILMNMILMRAGFVPAIIRVDERAQYIASLALAQDGGKIEPFIELVANDTLRSLELLVKAAKGMSIEESDDLDKEIELLKRKSIQNVTIHIDNLRYRVLWEAGLKDLIDKIDIRLAKFHELFSSHEIFYGNRETARSAQKTIEIIKYLEEILENFIMIKYAYHTYKLAGTNYFNTHAEYNISLLDYKYLISYQDQNQKAIRFEFLYDQVIDSDTIDKISNDLAKVVLKSIKDNTSKK